jgi:hypothetical protein
MTSAILETPPMPVQEAPWSIISMVASSDVQMYLLALKSFYARVGRGQIIAIIDRDMPGESRATLQRHFPGIRFVILEDIDTGCCQRGGTWERLLYLLDHALGEYAIQLDTDTLTTGPIDVVLDCIASNRAFTLANWDGKIVPVNEASADAETIHSRHIVIEAEKALVKLPGAAGLRYIRGSSGFAGFAKGAFDRRAAEDFHAQMSDLLGARFFEWGTEQVASNFAVANSPNALALPYPTYAVMQPEPELELEQV